MSEERTKSELRDIKTEEENVYYDDLLSSAGELGRYQLLLLFSTFPFYMYGVLMYFTPLFITYVPTQHWCWIPELENLTETDRRNLAIPKDDSTAFGYSHCQAYDLNWTEVLLEEQTPNDTWKTVPCRNGWEFNKTQFPYKTISIDFGWVCDKSSYPAISKSMFYCGSVLGGILIGCIADRFGRIPAVISSNLLGCIGGLSSAFASNFTEFTICSFIMGMANDSCMMLAVLIVIEYLAPKYRSVLSNTAFAIFYSASATALPFIARACGHWKTISIATSLPLGLVILAPLLFPESPRWLLSKGRIEETIKKIQTISQINRKEVPVNLIEQFKKTVSKQKKEESASLFSIFKRPLLRRLLILVCLDYMCCLIVFDGSVRNLEQLDFNFFQSFTASSMTELPSLILCGFIMDIFGRRWLAAITLTISCVFNILTVFVGNGLSSVVCAIVARFAISIALNTLMQWAAELIPTSVRGSGCALVHICGYLGVVASPYITYLDVYIKYLPFLIIGGIAGLGSAIALTLPETALKNLPHTFDDAEELVKDQGSKFWDMPCIKKNIKSQGHVNESFEM